MDIQLPSTFWLLSIMMLWTLEHKYLFESLLSRRGSEGPIVILYLTFWETTKLFSTMVTVLYVSTNDTLRSQFLHIVANTCYFPLKKKLLMAVKW